MEDQLKAIIAKATRIKELRDEFDHVQELPYEQLVSYEAAKAARDLRELRVWATAAGEKARATVSWDDYFHYPPTYLETLKAARAARDQRDELRDTERTLRGLCTEYHGGPIANYISEGSKALVTAMLELVNAQEAETWLALERLERSQKARVKKGTKAYLARQAGSKACQQAQHEAREKAYSEFMAGHPEIVEKGEAAERLLADARKERRAQIVHQIEEVLRG